VFVCSSDPLRGVDDDLEIPMDATAVEAPTGWVVAKVLTIVPWGATLLVERSGQPFLCKRAFPSYPEAVESLRHEAFLLERLRGAHLPHLCVSGEDSWGPYFLSEFVRGKTLADHIEQSIPMAVPWVAPRAFEALEFLHRATDGEGPLGVLHGDLHPGNVLLSADHRVLLLDLGLATSREHPRPPGGAFRGSARYASPEAARGEPCDERSDIFSLAATLLHAASGRAPRSGSTLPAVLLQAADEPLDAYARQASLGLPPALASALARCVAMAPEDRPRRASDVFGSESC
jgi:serine/threonine protein kinase